MTNTNTRTKFHRLAVIGFAAAAMLAVGVVGNDASAAPGHRQNQCRDDLREARVNYRTENKRLERLTELRVFRADRRATRRVHRIAADARANAQSKLTRRDRRAYSRNRNQCRSRVRAFRAASHELRAGINDINEIRKRQLRRARNTHGTVTHARPAWSPTPARTVVRDHRRHTPVVSTPANTSASCGQY